ncbi:MAG: GH25 family lysozyme [Bacillota bacterium]|nr:GH25 family lysozyme [Bacillota bacterium]
MKFGIDVSKWQGNFNMQRAKSEGVEFAIIRAACHTVKDSEFEDNFVKAEKAGIHTGAYIYAMDETPESAIATAKWLHEHCLKGKKFDFPIYYDVEDNKIIGTGKKNIIATVKAFCSTLEKLGYFVGVYASLSQFKTNLDSPDIKKYTAWVAAWQQNNPVNLDGFSIGLWQFGGEINPLRSTKIAGVTCDQDYAFIDFPSLIKLTGRNGYKGVKK